MAPLLDTKDAKAKAKDVAKATHELGRTIVTLLLKEPFYGHLLGGLVRRVSEDVPTAAVALTSRGPELIVNPSLLHQRTQHQRTGSGDQT